jgi:hypothetical protein
MEGSDAENRDGARHGEWLYGNLFPLALNFSPNGVNGPAP